MEMTPQRWNATNAYLAEVFGDDPQDRQLQTLMSRAVASGLPDIAVSPEAGRLLTLLARIATGEPRSTGRVLEVGTLAGYSGIHLARGLSAGGSLITIEFEGKHAAFAHAEFAAAGVTDRVEIVVEPALQALPRLARTLGPASLDLVFLDATKREYAAYFEFIAPMLRPGGLFTADNAIASRWWICDPPGDPDRDAMDRFNRNLANDNRFDAGCIPTRNGIVIGRKQ
ncbi:Catechol O-methyltransferase [Phycisphaerales bacterium]|nr:Catechol O-methyltransferase [Phycisphaerales bacterium]